jgi:uncharacterized membrane protein
MKEVANYIFIFTLAILFAVCPLKSASVQVGGHIDIWGAILLVPMQVRGILMIGIIFIIATI